RGRAHDLDLDVVEVAGGQLLVLLVPVPLLAVAGALDGSGGRAHDLDLDVVEVAGGQLGLLLGHLLALGGLGGIAVDDLVVRLQAEDVHVVVVGVVVGQALLGGGHVLPGALVGRGEAPAPALVVAGRGG
ncbi:hypothetical protein EG872_16385, partial [Enterococcus faecalis]